MRVVTVLQMIYSKKKKKRLNEPLALVVHSQLPRQFPISERLEEDSYKNSSYIYRITHRTQYSLAIEKYMFFVLYIVTITTFVPGQLYQYFR